MYSFRVWMFFGVVLLVLHPSAKSAANELPIRNGLVSHWDSPENLANTDAGAKAERWLNSAGSLAFVQSEADAQPKWFRKNGIDLLRFDGENDHLRIRGQQRTVSALTIVIIASPRDNSGGFRGLLAANAVNRRDYESGFTLDQGPEASARFDTINFEGAGFGGFRNLHKGSNPFKLLHCITATLDPNHLKASCYLDGKLSDTRPWSPTSIDLAELTLGARYYTNGPGSQQVRGYFEGDIAEVALFDRALSVEEISQLNKYFETKYGKLKSALLDESKKSVQHTPIERVPNPPEIQMLIPGFASVELPVHMTNVNNVLFRRDGVLVTLGYNGDVHLVRDSDQDGVEDQVSEFWKNDQGTLRGPIGMVWTPPDFKEGQGVIVSSKGKVSALVDTDGDDRADKEIRIADGWKEITQNVDAVGLALSSDGYLYFGLGTADYANPYQIDSSGKSRFDLKSDRGTIQRVNLQTLQRETFCTGVRFPIGIGFNEYGDLFCTDQEGATWLPNGNPADELLWIRQGKHYGFPPRHPKHNPSVLDEPSIYDYRPQHQSTCGMVWNIPNAWGKIFGPDSWKGDALVCGESRGKLWRTKAVRAESGYVAHSKLIACLQMLTVDCCVAPNGDLVVACHSGKPDWGTGPAGIGKLFRIRMVEPELPQPVLAWAESPTEFRLAFDRPITSEQSQNLQKNLSVDAGMHVKPGDHFENLTPPYAVVKKQSFESRLNVPIHSVSLTQDMRTIIVHVNECRANVNYAMRWSNVLGRSKIQDQRFPESSLTALSSYSEIAVDVHTSGIIAQWTPRNGISQRVWLPHWDLNIARSLTRGSSIHDQFFDSLKNHGTLSFQTQWDAFHWLRPDIQPGGQLDFEWPTETVELNYVSNADQIRNTSWKATDSQEWVSIELKMDLEDASKFIGSPVVSTNEDPTQRPVPIERFHLPWIDRVNRQEGDTTEPRIAKELEGGNWGRGRRLFHSDAAGCFKCHSLGNVAAKIGPDLSNLIHRDYESVWRDIFQPSFSINPDFIGHSIRLHSGEVLTGTLRTEQGRLILGDSKGVSNIVARDNIDEMKVSAISVMPEGLLKQFSEAQIKDLMTYLLTPAPSMPIQGKTAAPSVRSLHEVQRALADSKTPSQPLKNVRVILISGTKDHGPGEHDYPAWQLRWNSLLSAAENVEVENSWDFPSDAQLATADVLIFFQKGDWNAERAKKLDRYLTSGRGAVYLHWAVNGNDLASDFARRIGLASRGGSIRYRHGPLQLDIHNTDHPIMRNIDRLDLYDESYWLLDGDTSKIKLLASSVEDGKSQPQIWCYEQHGGRVFVGIPGHYNWTFDDPIFRIILLRAIAWSAREPIDRFNELVFPGARMNVPQR